MSEPVAGPVVTGSPVIDKENRQDSFNVEVMMSNNILDPLALKKCLNADDTSLVTAKQPQASEDTLDDDYPAPRSPKDVKDPSKYRLRAFTATCVSSSSEPKGEPVTYHYYEYIGPKIRTMGQDDRQYRLIRLLNNMEVMIIKENEARQAGASLTVGVGGIHDLPTYAGIAHFCEHMLFLGSEKYPDEAGFRKHVYNYNGCTNASTNMIETNYHFMTSNDGFYKALDMFAQFFICPLFNEDCAEREVKAVDSEHKKNIPEDSRRLFQLHREFADPHHPLNGFFSGNYQTLYENAKSRGENLRQVLIKFYEKYYSADIMKLCIKSNKDLDEATWTAVRMFSAVKSKGNTIPRIVTRDGSGHTRPYRKERHMGKLVRYKTLSSTFMLCLLFPTDDHKLYYMTKPHYYISELITYCGQHSLQRYLLEKGLITHNIYTACAFPYMVGIGGVFRVTFMLTEAGYHRYQEVIEAFFSYVQMIKDAGVSESFYKEIAQSVENSFEYRPCKVSYHFLTYVTDRMRKAYLPADKMFSGVEICEKFSPKVISKVLSDINSENFFAFLGSSLDDESIEKGLKSHLHQHHQINSNDDGCDAAVASANTKCYYPLTEKHYGIQYGIQEMDSKFMNSLKTVQPQPEFQMPPKNNFVCYDLDTLPYPAKNDKPTFRPTLLIHNKFGEVWHRKDDAFLSPQGKLMVKFIIPSVVKDRQNLACLRIYTQLINDLLLQISNDAEVGGIRINVNILNDGLGLFLTGTTPKMLLVLESIIDKIKNFNPTQLSFNNATDAFERILKNHIHHRPDLQSGGILGYTSAKIFYNWKETLETLQKEIDFDTVIRNSQEWFKKFYVKVLAVGYFDEDDAIGAFNKVIDKLQPNPIDLESGEINPNPGLEPNLGQIIIQTRLENEELMNSAVVLDMYAKSISDPKSVGILNVLEKLISPKFFSSLRTSQTLGYMVSICRVETEKGLSCLRAKILGEGNPSYLRLRMLDYFKQFRANVLEPITAKELKSICRSLYSYLARPFTDVNEEFSHYSKWIQCSFYCFDHKSRMLEELKHMTKKDILEFWDKYFEPLSLSSSDGDDSEKRHLWIHLYSSRYRMPTLYERQIYPETILALYGCLEKENIIVSSDDGEGIDYSDISEIVSSIHSKYPGFVNQDPGRKGIDTSVEGCSIVDQFKSELLARVSKATTTIDSEELDKAFESKKAFPRIALLMAIENYIEPGQNICVEKSSSSQVVFATSDGNMILEDFKSYGQSLECTKLLVPQHSMVPKYAEANPDDDSCQNHL
ncbi:metalloprotease [Mycoemilia scoparia]|uniref:Metalloprotease n=1 Tax=Mycoemilia scoparia TaxID=417184 RepID=A0A9W7ZUP7_9FUNG|nr:metalloprotease [Mycoemilia scoparia]